jgi:hypothetical protein
MRMDDKPSPVTSVSPLASIALGADQKAVSLLVGAVSGVIETHKSSTSESPLFRIADLNLGDGAMAATVVDAFRQQMNNTNAFVRVSGTELDESALESARELLDSRDALGVIGLHDASSSPAAELRNRLQCGGGADMVVYAHAAYPSKLPSFKLQRMVDRLGDMAAPHGAVVTLHNHGPSDVDDIRKQVFSRPAFATAGNNCNTQERLEQSFRDAKLHSFSVTVPNVAHLPVNLEAITAIFSGTESMLSGKDAEDAAQIRVTLEAMAGGKEKMDAAIEDMDDAARGKAVQYFEKRVKQAGGHDLPITIGGGQMVMAFRSQALAQEAFAAVNRTCMEMNPPAIALPISKSVMPEFDKKSAHSEWKSKLAEHGIHNPPKVCQADLDNNRSH